ncbi:DNA replication factor cdt1-like [Plakobranchus ocellatus]|uniref:DNA replication factor cdt1-like n=1 Tax=Plakobranchus ocellatus TaxID=259542 RepID=A0AAV4C1M5_9GAST|nr:DNA replication factor cdt1-like [Plakobranchus ocellatus]
MAQPKVNDFFSARKKRDGHPAKKRKIEIQSSTPMVLSLPTNKGLKSDSVAHDVLTSSQTLTKNTIISTRSRSSCAELKSESSGIDRECSHSETEPINPESQKLDPFPGKLSTHFNLGSFSSEANGKDIPRSARSQTVSQSRLKQRNKSHIRSQTKITELFGGKVTVENAREDKDETSWTVKDKSASSVNEPSTKESKAEKKKEGIISVTAEITSTEDDHRTSGMSTPRKRNVELEIADETEPPKTRKCKVPNRRASKCPSSPSKSAKKKLDLDRSETSESCESEISSRSNSKPFISEDVSKGEFRGENEDTQAPETEKKLLLRLVSEVESPDLPISPLALTPERQEDSPQQTPSPQPSSPKLHDLSLKLKALSKMNGKALKNRLKQNGKLDGVKQKVNDLGKALDKTEELKAAQDEVDGEAVLDSATAKKDTERLPAYQRYEYLAKAGRPTLALPFSYKALAGTFQAMESVVSMLHNRSEMCTFSKLKAAVQNFTKKNFEEKTVGQIKTVAPDAYIFRQEKNVCSQTNKKGYTLTVDADLSHEVLEQTDEKVCKTPEGKPVFTAAALIQRKQKFHNSLLGLVMKHHRAFLESLKQPLSIPDSKVTRWHPQFRLDEVPDIVPSQLPQPPDVRVYHSAKDVLDTQRGRLNPRIEEALAKVTAESKTSATPSPSQPSPALKPSSMKGIPPALLAKIRAKEALKMEAALTRDPEEESKTKMMSHLPEMIRILRSYFITEKKPALPLEAIYKKLEDSYRSGISRKKKLPLDKAKSFKKQSSRARDGFLWAMQRVSETEAKE